ncbi:NUDIX hydrolase [Bradyrhizobium sp. CCGB20]|uniref:NUDIX hydrolase n=1 Tax=Bradyrhizobium sp. CCGB20 TaxID=2949633 RepID=UPI0020B28045|nr:NUDIX hydrolase [Bradyrhizobium sp. CCGB20]MCP3402102.1 NUDIX hydrolase [Bradyrhizobium sp. CCGB20]
MTKSSKLVAAKRGKVLLVRRRSDGRWMSPGGRRRPNESEKECLRREIKEELPKLKLGRVSLWKEVTAKNKRSGRKMSDAIFVAKNARGKLVIGDPKEIDRAAMPAQKQASAQALVPMTGVGSAHGDRVAGLPFSAGTRRATPPRLPAPPNFVDG